MHSLLETWLFGLSSIITIIAECLPCRESLELRSVSRAQRSIPALSSIIPRELEVPLLRHRVVDLFSDLKKACHGTLRFPFGDFPWYWVLYDVYADRFKDHPWCWKTPLQEEAFRREVQGNAVRFVDQLLDNRPSILLTPRENMLYIDFLFVITDPRLEIVTEYREEPDSHIAYFSVDLQTASWMARLTFAEEIVMY